MGVLRGNEAAQVVWSFAPGKQKTYDLRVPCLLYDPSDEAAAAAAAAALHSTAATVSVTFPKGSGPQLSTAAVTTTEWQRQYTRQQQEPVALFKERH